MSKFFLFVVALAGIFAIVPLATWAATGQWREAWRALKGYMVCMGILAGLSAVFILAAVIGSIP